MMYIYYYYSYYIFIYYSIFSIYYLLLFKITDTYLSKLLLNLADFALLFFGWGLGDMGMMGVLSKVFELIKGHRNSYRPRRYPHNSLYPPRSSKSDQTELRPLIYMCLPSPTRARTAVVSRIPASKPESCWETSRECEKK